MLIGSQQQDVVIMIVTPANFLPTTSVDTDQPGQENAGAFRDGVDERGSASEAVALVSPVMMSILDVVTGRKERHSSRGPRLEAGAARTAR
jgi:hypothetical protein